MCGSPLQVRDRLPHLKAIVQYKGKLSEQYPNVYEVTHTHKSYEVLETSHSRTIASFVTQFSSHVHKALINET